MAQEPGQRGSGGVRGRGWAALWEQKREDAFPGQPESEGRSGWCQGGLSGEPWGSLDPLGAQWGCRA